MQNTGEARDETHKASTLITTQKPSTLADCFPFLPEEIVSLTGLTMVGMENTGMSFHMVHVPMYVLKLLSTYEVEIVFAVVQPVKIQTSLCACEV